MEIFPFIFRYFNLSPCPIQHSRAEELTHLGNILLKRAFASSSLSTLGTFLSFAYAGPRMVRMAVLPIWSASASVASGASRALRRRVMR